MAELSIFIDESGDYGTNSKFYLVTFLFHNQDSGIENQLAKLKASLVDMGFSADRAIHTGPIVRKEDEYQDMPLADRRRIFSRLFGFTKSCGVSYRTICLEKRQYPDVFKLKARLAREVSLFFQENIEYFTSFDKAIVYYDNGQRIVTELVNAVLGAIFFDAEIRKVTPSDYRLFQCADLICTLELLRAKNERSIPFTRSEEIFFGNLRTLRKDYLKQLERLRF